MRFSTVSGVGGSKSPPLFAPETGVGHRVKKCSFKGGNEFSKRYGNAVHDYEELDKIIDYVNDIELLGSAI